MISIITGCNVFHQHLHQEKMVKKLGGKKTQPIGHETAEIHTEVKIAQQ